MLKKWILKKWNLKKKYTALNMFSASQGRCSCTQVNTLSLVPTCCYYTSYRPARPDQLWILTCLFLWNKNTFDVFIKLPAHACLCPSTVYVPRSSSEEHIRSRHPSEMAHLGQNTVPRPQQGLQGPPWASYVLCDLLSQPLSRPLSIVSSPVRFTPAILSAWNPSPPGVHTACSPERSSCPPLSSLFLEQPIEDNTHVPSAPVDKTQPAWFFLTTLIPPKTWPIGMKFKVNRRLVYLLIGILNA